MPGPAPTRRNLLAVAPAALAALLHAGALGSLYGAAVETVAAPDARRAFLPG